jgi:uncharacterized protein (DUF1697 family)
LVSIIVHISNLFFTSGSTTVNLARKPNDELEQKYGGGRWQIILSKKYG